MTVAAPRAVTPYLVGHIAQATATTAVCPVTTAPAVGDTLVAVISIAGSGSTLAGVSDSKGSPWTSYTSSLAGRPLCFGWVYHTTGLTTSDTITLTVSGAQTLRMTVIGIPGSWRADQSPAGNGGTMTTGTASAATGALAVTGEVCIGGCSQSGSTVPQSQSWTLFENFSTGTVLTSAYLNAASAASQTFTVNNTAHPIFDIGVITFQPGQIINTPGPAVSETATVSAAGSVTFLGTASVPVAATVSAAGSVTFLGSATRPVTAAVSAAGSVTAVLSGSASVPVSVAVAAAGSVTFLGSASVPVAATVAAAGSVTPVLSGSSAVSVSAAITSTGAVGTGGLATLGWAVTVSAAGSLTLPGSATRPVTATVSAAGSVTFLGTATRPVTATVAAAGSVTFVGGAAAAISAAVSAAGFIAAPGAASVSVTAAVAAAGTVLAWLTGDASLNVTAAVSATGYASGGASVISGGAMPWTFFADYAVAPFADIGPVQVVAFTADWQLSGFGSGEATIAVGPKSALPRSMLLQLWVWRLWAFYQGKPVWAGCPTGVTDQGDQTVTVALSELPGYLAVKQYALNHTYTGVEQCTIAADLASPLSNIGVAVATQPGSGQNRDRTYTFLQANRGQMLTDLSQVINGPEFRSEYATGAGGAGCTLRIAYPRVGTAGDLAVVVPHGAISFRTTWAGDMMRTRTFAVGDLAPNAPTTATRPVVTIVAPQAGVPELDHVDDWPGVSVASTLNENASAYSQSYAQPALSLEVVMPLMSPLLGSYLVGDDVAVSLADPLVPSGLNATGRLTALRLDAGSGTVTWTVSITLPHPRRYATLSAQLKSLHRKTAAIFHNSLAAPPGGINP